MVKFVCQDAMAWLYGKKNVGAIVTGIADSNEIGISVKEWIPWFRHLTALCLNATSEDCPCVFIQTDRKEGGRWLSKAAMTMKVAELMGFRLLWHKISLRHQPGTIDMFRPGYTNMLAFSQEAKIGKATPDVIPPGRLVYENATNWDAAMVGVEFAKRFTNKLVDPFCGRGTIPAIANGLGMDVTAVDIDKDQIEEAKKFVREVGEDSLKSVEPEYRGKKIEVMKGKRFLEVLR